MQNLYNIPDNEFKKLVDEAKKVMFTIWYWNKGIMNFLLRLFKNNIEEVIDVRSKPFSHDENFIKWNLITPLLNL